MPPLLLVQVHVVAAASQQCHGSPSPLHTPRRNRNRPHWLPAGLLSMPYALMKGGWLALAVQAALLPLFALSGQASRCLSCAPYRWLAAS